MLSKSLTVALGMGSVPSVTTPYTLAAVAGAGGSSRSIFASCIPSSVKLGLYCKLSMSCLMSAIISSDYISFILWSLGRKQPVLPFSFGPPMLCGTVDMNSDLWSMQTATILRTFFGCPCFSHPFHNIYADPGSFLIRAKYFLNLTAQNRHIKIRSPHFHSADSLKFI